MDTLKQFESLKAEPETTALEIAQGITTEEMKALFFDGAMIEPPYKVYQLNSKGHRYYYKFGENGEPIFFPSVTTILSQTLPKSPYLIKWMLDKGEDEANRYMMERASYGTYMHGAFEKLIIEHSFDFDSLKKDLKIYIESNNLPDDFIYYADDLKKDILSFAQFIRDYDVKPIAVEISLTSSKGYAGMVDLVCSLKKSPKNEERINAIIDFKSGKKGFYESHEIQLEMYREMWNENFPQYPIEKMFNFSPKDWRKRPTYNFKDQSNSENAKKLPYLLELAKIEDNKINNTFTSISGVIDLDSDKELTDNILTISLAELVKKNK